MSVVLHSSSPSLVPEAQYLGTAQGVSKPIHLREGFSFLYSKKGGTRSGTQSREYRVSVSSSGELMATKPKCEATDSSVKQEIMPVLLRSREWA